MKVKDQKSEKAGLKHNIQSLEGGHGNSLQYSCLENPHGQRSWVGYSPWGHKESDMTEWLSTRVRAYTHTHTFSCSHVQRWEFNHKEGWELKNWFFQTVVLEKTVENLLDCKDEIKPVHPKGNQPWIFIGRTDAEAPILWSSDVRSWLTGKDLDAGKDWRQEEKGMTEDEVVRQHHPLDGHKSKQTLGDSEGQESSPRGHKESDMTYRLNNKQQHMA